MIFICFIADSYDVFRPQQVDLDQHTKEQTSGNDSQMEKSNGPCTEPWGLIPEVTWTW